MNSAGMPLLNRAPTWSDIKALSGLMTKVGPSLRTAGIWKHRDLPAPVGKTAKSDSPFKAARIDLKLTLAQPVDTEEPQCGTDGRHFVGQAWLQHLSESNRPNVETCAGPGCPACSCVWQHDRLGKGLRDLPPRRGQRRF